MYDKDITFHSDRDYPIILSSGSSSYSKGSGAITVDLTAATPNDNYLVWEEYDGWRRQVVFNNISSNGAGKVYQYNGRLYAWMSDNQTRSGVIKWRIYGNKS